MSISAATFGEFEGKRVDRFTLRSDSGVEVEIINYGVAVSDWKSGRFTASSGSAPLMVWISMAATRPR